MIQLMQVKKLKNIAYLKVLGLPVLNSLNIDVV